jgi:PiT family inorganic phosphate transporter
MVIHGFLILTFAFIAGIYMAWNIGANDAANGMASPVGARAITMKQALFICGILDFIGAAFIGSHVTKTILKDIVDPALINDPSIICIGLLSALASASFWVFFSTWSQYPISTTHSIVGAMIGFGIIAGGPSVINWKKVIYVSLSWIVSPFFSGLLSFMIFTVIRKNILMKRDVFKRALMFSPIFSGAALFVIFFSLLLKTPLGDKIGLSQWESLCLSLFLMSILSTAGYILFRSFIMKRDEEGAEEIFRWLQVMTACYVALAHGANDVANAIGPLAGIYIIVITGSVVQEAQVPFFLLVIGGIVIAIGVITWGHRVIQTVGLKITSLTNTRGFSVDFGVATSVLIASKLGLPVSTTHAAVGAVIGVGVARGIDAVDFGMVWRIILYWVMTLPISALTCMIVFKIFSFIFL